MTISMTMFVFFKQSHTKPYFDLTAGVTAQEEGVVAAEAPPVNAEEYIRGDMIPKATGAPSKKH